MKKRNNVFKKIKCKCGKVDEVSINCTALICEECTEKQLNNWRARDEIIIEPKNQKIYKEQKINNIRKLNKKEVKMVKRTESVKSKILAAINAGKSDDDIATELACRKLYVKFIRAQVAKSNSN